jgi:hypothetical protein
VSLSNSSEIENQFTMMFQDVMEEAMSILEAEEAAAAVASSSTRGPTRRPTVADTQPLLAKIEEREFFDMLGEHRLYALTMTQLFSRLVGPIYTGDIKHTTIILGSVASHDCSI